MIDVKIRYNTLSSDNGDKWRILLDGREFLCDSIKIKVPTETTRDIVWDPSRNQNVEKFHISCSASQVSWNGKEVNIE